MIQRLMKYKVEDAIDLIRRPVEVVATATYREVGIRSFGRGVFHKDSVSGEDLGSKRVFYIEPGDLLFSNVFAWEGAVALASEREGGMIGSHRFMTYRVNAEVANARYLYYYFYAGPGQDAIHRASPGSAGRNKTLGIKAFANQEISLPDPQVQHQIVIKLDAITSKLTTITVLAAEASTNEVNYLAASGIEHVLARWADGTIRVADVCSLVNDIVRPGEDQGHAKEFVGLEHIAPHTGERIGLRPVGDEKGRKFRFAPGDVLYGYLRPYLNKVWVADRHGLCSVEQYVLRPNGRMPAELIAAGLRRRSSLDKVIALTHNLQLPRLRSGLLMGLEIPVISRAAQKDAVVDVARFAERVRRYDELRRRRSELLDNLRPAILNAAFSGEL